MKRIVLRLVIICLFLFASALFLLDLTVTRATPAQRRSVARPSGTQVGDLFKNNCARCHGADGHGDTPLGHTYNAPDFTDPEWWRKHSNITGTRTLVAIVSRGKGGMPAFGKKLTRSEIGVLVNHVRRFREKSKQNEP